jgi:hypothetical protein
MNRIRRRLIRMAAAMWDWIRPSNLKMWEKEESTDRARRPKPGWVYNPLTGGQRNMQCLCGSGRKSKHCCGQFMALPIDVAEKIRNALP